MPAHMVAHLRVTKRGEVSVGDVTASGYQRSPVKTGPFEISEYDIIGGYWQKRCLTPSELGRAGGARAADADSLEGLLPASAWSRDVAN